MCTAEHQQNIIIKRVVSLREKTLKFPLVEENEHEKALVKQVLHKHQSVPATSVFIIAQKGYDDLIRSTVGHNYYKFVMYRYTV